MSKREKITTLYSRNGIRITKTDNIQNGNFVFGEFTRQEKLENFIANNKTGNYVTVKHESPLGFYYYTRNIISNFHFFYSFKLLLFLFFIFSLVTRH